MIQVSVTSIAGIRTNEIILGEGLPVVMLHGWGANLQLMQPLAERLATMGFRCYVPDLPGFGQTEKPPAGWSVHDYTNWVLAYLDFHQLTQVYVIGHSFGGRLSLVLGAQHSQRIRKMILANSAGVPYKSNQSASLRLKTYRLALNTLNRIGLQQPANQLRHWYTERYGSTDYKAATGTMRETFVKVVNEDLLPFAAQVKPSTLLIWGGQDEDTPLWQGQLLEKTIPDAGLVVYDDAGHYSYLDRLPDATRVIDHFFKHD